MKINQITIKSIGRIEELNINFNDSMNFICGPNGIGKTTVLECIAHSFINTSSNILKRSAAYENGVFTIEIQNGEKVETKDIKINSFDPEKQDSIHGLTEYSSKILSLKIERTFKYVPLQSISKDSLKPAYALYEENKSGVNLNDVKNWFVNRYLYSAHQEALTSTQLYNFNIAKSSFSVLDNDFTFSRVDASTNEIMVQSPNGEIYYEYLSSGFKSCLSIIFGIIKETELRFQKPGIKADGFDGIVLLDEIELHLHPEWQAKISNILRTIFPNIQFIATTHSPHVLQNAKPNEIIALAFNNGKVYRREMQGSTYGYQGWTVEEILKDIMGMADTRTDLYKGLIKQFEAAIESEEYNTALCLYKELEQLLHPDNHLRKLLSLELASVKGTD